MLSREYIGGFFMGFGISSFCHGLYLMYVGNKLVQLSKTIDDMDMKMKTEEIELNLISDVD
jgi:hypothetical protein